jgi:hypothetical protein
VLFQLPVLDTIKLVCAGWSVVLNIVMDPEFLHWCPSVPRPHWYKSPKANVSVWLVAAWLAPKFLSIHVLPVIGFITSTTLVGYPLQNTAPGLYKLLVGQGTSDDTPLHTYSDHLQVHNWSLQKYLNAWFDGVLAKSEPLNKKTMLLAVLASIFVL